jgi:hypothetical protein
VFFCKRILKTTTKKKCNKCTKREKGIPEALRPAHFTWPNDRLWAAQKKRKKKKKGKKKKIVKTIIHPPHHLPPPSTIIADTQQDATMRKGEENFCTARQLTGKRISISHIRMSLCIEPATCVPSGLAATTPAQNGKEKRKIHLAKKEKEKCIMSDGDDELAFSYVSHPIFSVQFEAYSIEIHLSFAHCLTSQCVRIDFPRRWGWGTDVQAESKEKQESAHRLQGEKMASSTCEFQ